MRLLTLFAVAAVCYGTTPAQVPEGYYVWCSFQSSRKGETGIFFSHPRTPGNPLKVTGLSADLKWVPNGRQGASCVIRRPSDGALIVGERAPQNHSVDLHIITLKGRAVYRDKMIGLGTSSAVGEVPQCALLPDGKILVAATDLIAGPLAVYKTQGFNLQGIGIVDPIGGNVTVVKMTNGNNLPGVMNALTVSPDGKTCYFGNWVSSKQGDVWALPIPGGGAATKIAQVPAGLSNLAMDQDGQLLIATLNGPPNLYRLDLKTKKLAVIKTSNGPLNAIALESVTGNYAVVSANSGIPVRSVFWMTRSGKHTLLTSPNKATVSGIDVNPTPKAYGPDTPGKFNSYHWELAPNPGGLPLVGSSTFSLTLEPTNAPGRIGILAMSLHQLEKPVNLLGFKLNIDPATVFFTGVLPPSRKWTLSLPLPNDRRLIGASFCAQTFHNEGTSWAASPGISVTLL